jgi:hypothetical protein
MGLSMIWMCTTSWRLRTSIWAPWRRVLSVYLAYYYKSKNTDTWGAACQGAGTQFTCFTNTKVQILTWGAACQVAKVLSLLALLVQKYKYWQLRSYLPGDPGTQFTYLLRPRLSLLALLVQQYKYWHLRSCLAEQITEYLQYILRPCLTRFRYRLRLPAGLYVPYALCLMPLYVLCLMPCLWRLPVGIT